MNRIWIGAIVVAIVVSLGGIAIYQWRADIKQVVYDEIFREMAKNELAEKDREIARNKLLMEGTERAVADALREREIAQKKVDMLTGLLRKQSYSKEPVSQGLSKALDAIQDYGATPAPQKEEAK